MTTKVKSSTISARSDDIDREVTDSFREVADDFRGVVDYFRERPTSSREVVEPDSFGARLLVPGRSSDHAVAHAHPPASCDR